MSRLNLSHLQLVNDHNHVGAGLGTQSRPYVCSFGTCDKAFARKSDLARHFKIHTNDRAFVCTYRGCGKSFIQRSALTVHYRVHTGERPHHCETCNKAFADSSSLARHRRIHTGKRPYTCHAPNCGKPFARRNTLLKHFKRQHPELPPPSTSAQRPSIHVPVQNSASRASSGSFLSPGSIANGEHYSASPSSTGAPHGFAAPHPSESAAYPFHGGFPGQILGGPPGSQQSIIFQGAGGVRPHFHQSPNQTGQGSLAHFPHSAHFSGGYVPQTPASPAPNGSRNKFPPIHTHNLGTGQYPNSLSAYPHPGGYPLTRFPSDGGMMWNRPVSAPGEQRFPSPHEASQWSGGNVGGGFHASQLSVPQTPSHVSPIYSYSLPMQQRSATNPLPKTRIHHSPAHGSDDERDEPLVSVSESAPTFSVHPPQGVSVPMTSVGSHMSLPPNGSQILLTHPYNGRLHSAPPSIQRFNSMPTVPTIEGWDQSGAQYQCHSVGSGKSADEEWEEIEKEMISREASLGVDRENTPGTEERKTPRDGEAINHWGQPIEFPDPRGHRFSSGASVSTTNTLVNSVQGNPNSDTLPPIHIFSGQNHPMALTPLNPNGMYPTPITPAHGWNEQLKPVFMGRNFPMQYHHDKENGEENIEDITLTTPPKGWTERKESQSVDAVGLGIANVHFGETHIIEKEDGPKQTTRYMSEDSEEEEDPMDDDDDDSDEEFVLGRKPRRGARKSARKGRAKGVVRKRRS